MIISHLVYDPSIGRKKPESIVNKETACPFCDLDSLENIIDQEESIIILKNKFPTLRNTNQTVIIEIGTCDEEFSTYEKDHLYKLIRFAFRHWFQMRDSGEYRSVLLFKNYGPFSGGSIHHSHMQIVGLEKVDYKVDINLEHFEGHMVAKEHSVCFTVSTKPKMGFYELNVSLEHMTDLNIMADMIQIAAHFILHHFHARCNSYNIFFYELDKKIFAKIIPRFATSPLFVGYSIAQVASNTDEIAERIQELYFSRS